MTKPRAAGPFASPAPTPPQPVTAEGLRREYPHWRIWRSDVGRWWANRTGTLTPAQIRAGCVVGLDADDLPGLADELFRQERLREGGQ